MAKRDNDKHSDISPEEAAARMAEQMPGNIIPADWVEEHTGFPPYLRMEVGKAFRGTILLRDERDPSFPRYHVQSAVKLDCQTGPVDNGEIITILPGEIFTISTYAALPLERYFGFEVAVLCKSSRKLPPNEASEGKPRDLFEFKLMVSPNDSKLLASRRKEDQLYLKEAHERARKLALDNMVKMAMQGANGRQSVNASAA